MKPHFTNTNNPVDFPNVKNTINKRIKELADQAGLGVKHGGIVLTRNVNAAEAFEQFAELIVRECAEFQTNRSTERHGYDKHEDGVAIKEHFGVKE